MPTTMDAPDFVSEWGGTHHYVDLGGQTHYAEFDGPQDAIPMVLVHGLGGSHMNWVLVASRLAKHRQVYVIDLAGFGLTHPEGRSTSVEANSRLLIAFLQRVVKRRAILVGNSMGGFITTMVCEARPDLVAGAVLLNPALPLPAQRPDIQVAANFVTYLIPKLGEAYLRRGAKKTSPELRVERMFGVCIADMAKVDQRFIESSVKLAKERDSYTHSDDSFLEAARSLLKKNSRPKAARARMAAINAPVLLVQGEVDRLVPVKAARIAAEAYPRWTYVELAGIGHTPMIEIPNKTVDIIEKWVAEKFS